MNVEGCNIVVRELQPGDRNFVLATWMRSAKELSKMPRDKFFAFIRPQVEADVANGVTLIACDEEVPGTIYAWCCIREGAVRWAYTAFGLRKKGLFTLLKDTYEEAEAAAAAA